MPESGTPHSPSTLDRVVDDQALAVLAAIDDLRHDLPGSIHDARVALRKLRSTLVVFRPMLDRGASTALEGDLRWFAGELGAARDSQVVRSRVTTALHGHDVGPDEGEALLAALDTETEATWDRARDALSAPRLVELVTRLDQARLRSIADHDAPPRFVPARIGSVLGELIRRGERAAADAVDDDRLHRLRKRVKRVRFAVASARDGAFEGLGTGSGVGRVSRTLEDLQELLGEYQDAVVTAGILDRIAIRRPQLAGLAGDLAGAQRNAAASIRAKLPDGIHRVRAAATRLQSRAAKQEGDAATARPPGVHLGSA